MMQPQVLECFETVLMKGDEVRFRLYEVTYSYHLYVAESGPERAPGL